MFNAGDVAAGSVVRIPFNTEAIAGGSITIGTNGTIAIYKDDSTTERSSANGITFTEDHDAHTGTHLIKIDLSDNTDAGFYAAAGSYLVKYHTATIDGKSVSAWVGAFTIDKTRQKVDVVSYGGSAGTFSGGRPEVNASHWGGVAVASATVRADAIAISGDTTAADNFETMLDGTGGQTLKLGKLSVVASGGSRAVEFLGNGSSEGFFIQGGATGSGFVCNGGATTGYAAEFIAQGGNSNAVNLQGQGNGYGLYIVGGITGGGMAIESNQIGLTILSAVNTGILVSVDGAHKAIQLLSGGGTGALVGNIEGNLNSVSLCSQLTTYTGNTPQTGDCFPRLGAPAGASIAADIAAAKADTAATLVDTNELQTDWTNGGRLDNLLDGVKAKTDLIPASPAAVGSQMNLADGAITSAKFTVAPITGVASGFLERMTQTWRRWFKRTRYDKAGGTIKTYADDNSTPITTQTVISDAGQDDIGAAT